MRKEGEQGKNNYSPMPNAGLAHKIIQEFLEKDIHSIASKGIVATEEIEHILKDASVSVAGVRTRATELSDSKPDSYRRSHLQGQL